MRLLFLLLACMAFGASPACAEPMRAALMLEHEQSSAWNDMLRKGFTEAAAKAGMAADIVIAPANADQTAIFRQTAADHDLVILASDGLHEVLRDNAANFRKVKFGVIDAGIRAPNVMCVTFADEQAAYLAGAAAAILAEAGGEPVIGWLSGMDTPAMRSLFNGYAEGAHFAVPACRVVQAVAGSFTDGAKAAAKTAWLLKSGAKVIALAAGAGNAEAAQVAAAAGAPIIELDAPSGRNALGVIAKAADRAVSRIMDSVARGNFGGKQIIIYDLANKGTDFAGLETYLKNHAAPEKLGRRVRELRGELTSGSIRVPSLRQRTLCDCLD